MSMCLNNPGRMRRNAAPRRTCAQLKLAYQRLGQARHVYDEFIYLQWLHEVRRNFRSTLASAGSSGKRNVELAHLIEQCLVADLQQAGGLLALALCLAKDLGDGYHFRDGKERLTSDKAPQNPRASSKAPCQNRSPRR
jgi:hypothetical protein